jgi:D-alanine-D-alanine ligase
MKRIGIFCGGYSSEYEISLKSAQTIRDNFPETFTPFLIQVQKDSWFVEIEGLKMPLDKNTCSFEHIGVRLGLDAALVYIHGDPGENGKIQAYLDLLGIPYLNSGPLASALSFDKWYCNQFLRAFGIPVAASVRLTKYQTMDTEEIIQHLGLPLFVKPADSGSSFGISKVKEKELLQPAVEHAFQEGNQVVVEAFLDGIEVTCAVFRRKDGLYALPLTEIASENEFFDYEAKYLGKSQEITPARVSSEQTKVVQSAAKKVYDLLQLRSVARIDFMLVDSIPYVIEVNTTPGFSPASIVPQMLACEGMSIRDFWMEICEVELEQQ